MKKLNYKGPVVLVVMDGIGLSPHENGNAVAQARKENLTKLMTEYPFIEIGASGKYVGLPDGQMGNSEVGHYTMGSGVIPKSSIVMANESFETGKVWEGETWKGSIKNVLDHDSQLHFIGLMSDGRVHSDIDHMFKMIEQADKEGIQKVRVHWLSDGRDVAARSEPKYLDMGEELLSKFRAKGRDYCIASGSGREFATMNRYWSDPEMLKRSLSAHVYGTARPFSSAHEAIETFKKEDPNLDDQWVPDYTIVDENGKPVGKMQDNDSVIFFNFRADRAIQFGEMMELSDSEFTHFDRGNLPKVHYAGLVEYDTERHLPTRYLIETEKVQNSLAEFEVKNGIHRFAISESIKFGHVTFYFNGNKKGKFDDTMEEYIDVPNKISTQPWQSPWMRSDDITDQLVDAIKSGKYQSLLINYPNGDIIGHEAIFEPCVASVEAVDIALGRLMKAVDEVGGVLVVTADHGNVEESFYLDENQEPKRDESGEIIRKTSHSTNPIPFIIYDNTENRDKYVLKKDDFGLANVASTIAMLDGLDPPSEWEESLIELK